MPKVSKVRTGPPTPDLVAPTHAQPWADQALCTQHDPELWFCDTESHDTTNERRRREAIAKDICSGCTVKVECLAYALATDQRFGIWGGLAAWERRQLRFAGRTA